MSGTKDKKAPLIILVLIVCIPIILGLAYKYRSELKIGQNLVQLKKAVLSSDGIFVKIDLFAGVNNKSLRVIFNIPCKDMKTKQDILDNMTIIKHEMLMSMDNPQNKISFEKRDFKRIKANCLAVLQKYAHVDVNKVYVEFFAHN